MAETADSLSQKGLLSADGLWCFFCSAFKVVSSDGVGLCSEDKILKAALKLPSSSLLVRAAARVIELVFGCRMNVAL